MKRIFYSIALAVCCLLLPVACREELPQPGVTSAEEQLRTEVRLRFSLPTSRGGSEMLDLLMTAERDTGINWLITDRLFPSAPRLPKVGLMAYNNDLARWVYGRLTVFRPEASSGLYVADLQLPPGNTVFYALYAPDRIGAGLPYIDPNAQRHERMRWNFLWTGDYVSPADDLISKDEVWGAAFPTLMVYEEDYDMYREMRLNPYDGLHPLPEYESTVPWRTVSTTPWQDWRSGRDFHIHHSLLSGKTAANLLLTDEGAPAQEITIPLYRDYARVRLFVGSAVSPDVATYHYRGVAYLNFPSRMSPSFRDRDTEGMHLWASTPYQTENMMWLAGAECHGVKPETACEVPVVPRTAGGAVDYSQMSRLPYEQHFLPQYLAPYIPEANTWQGDIFHPRILLRTDYTVQKADTTLVVQKDFVFDVGEETAPGVYSGPIYPNRDYVVYVVLPEQLEQEVYYRVESWENKTVNLPPFQ